jgi:hypothetical protein
MCVRRSVGGQDHEALHVDFVPQEAPNGCQGHAGLQFCDGLIVDDQ